jgi:hypothetical protein
MMKETEKIVESITTNFGFSYALMLQRAYQLDWVYHQKSAWITEAKMPKIDGKILYETVRNKYRNMVIETDNCVAEIEVNGLTASIDVHGSSQAENSKLIAKLRKDMPSMKLEDEFIDVTFWYQTGKGPMSYDRKLDAPSWQDIADNYPKMTKDKLSHLKEIDMEKAIGKLILWQGSPGTGKTYAIRALAKEWQDWCKIHYVLDPEQFFGSGDYLLSVILNNDDDDGNDKWRLIILEDSGELLRKDAKTMVGQGLSRLLNLCDGMLGQGLKILILITTNEELGCLHEAISRPGRCLNQISFDEFDIQAGNEWLKSKNCQETIKHKSTLADLYEITQGGKPIKPVRSVGF